MPTSDTKNIPSTVSDKPHSDFKGYSLDDIRYRRALVMLQREFAKQKILSGVKKIQKRSPFSKSYTPAKSGVMGKAGAIAGKLITGLNYVDYLMLGFTVFNSGRKIFRFFKRK